MHSIEHVKNHEEWAKAVKAADNNELLAAVYTVTDEATATAAVNYGSNLVGNNHDGALMFDRLPEEFIELLRISHNTSSPTTFPSIKYHRYTHAYNRGATGLHFDGRTAYKGDGALSLHFVARGSVDATFVPLPPTAMNSHIPFRWPQAIIDRMTQEPEEHCESVVGNYGYIPKDKAHEVGEMVTLRAGQLAAFAAYGAMRGTSVERIPVGHQFVSLGGTPEERDSRTSAFIDTDSLRTKERESMPVGELLDSDFPEQELV